MKAVGTDFVATVVALSGIALAAREFWTPAENFVDWVKSDDWYAPLLLLIVFIIVLFKNVVVAAQIKEIEEGRSNPIGNRHQRRKAAAIQRRKRKGP